MGYYSKVRILADKTVAKKVFAALQVHGSPFDEIKVSPTGNTYYFEADTKWYEDDPECFPEVDAVMGVLDEADESKYYYIRVGEEDGDIDRFGRGCGYLEGDIYTDDRSELIDAWRDVNPDGEIQDVPAIERLVPYWEAFKEKAKLFGIKINKDLPDITG